MSLQHCLMFANKARIVFTCFPIGKLLVVLANVEFGCGATNTPAYLPGSSVTKTKRFDASTPGIWATESGNVEREVEEMRSRLGHHSTPSSPGQNVLKLFFIRTKQNRVFIRGRVTRLDKRLPFVLLFKGPGEFLMENSSLKSGGILGYICLKQVFHIFNK